MKRILVQPVKNIEGRQMKYLEPENKAERDMTTVDAIRSLVFNLPSGRLTMTDSINGKRVIDAIARKDDYALELDDDLYKWLKDMVEHYSPMVFGVNACQIQDAVDELEKKLPEVKKGK